MREISEHVGARGVVQAGGECMAIYLAVIVGFWLRRRLHAAPYPANPDIISSPRGAGAKAMKHNRIQIVA